MATAGSHELLSSFKPILENELSKGNSADVSFNPDKHLAYEYPEKSVMIKDIGYHENTGVSPVAVSQPFRLFTPEAIRVIRSQVLNEEVFKNCFYQSNLAACQLRGYASKYAPFVYDAWTHPETLAIISQIAGIELVPSMNFEIGHVNVSVKSEQTSKEELAAAKQGGEGANGSQKDDKPIVGWHVDSYPFVCVLMLSDCTNMIGGETALRTANGEIIKVRGPQMGCAVVMQGRYIIHQALRALGAQERITMVTSFRPKSPHLRDDSVLTTTRSVSDLSQLYYEFGKYRLEIVEERIRSKLRRLREANTAGRRTDTLALKNFLGELESFIVQTNQEIIPEENVAMGHMPEIVFPDDKHSTAPRAKI